jgi:hypothetical protein
LIVSDSEEQHLEHLREVIAILKKNMVTVNWNKSLFAVREITFLGFDVCREGIYPNIARSRQQKDHKSQNKKQLMSILGQCNFYRDIVPDYSRHAAELHDHLKDRSQFVCIIESENALRKIMEELLRKTLLKHPKTSDPFTI